MKRYTRDRSRRSSKVKSDVEATSKIVREDVYDLIKDTQTREEAEKIIRSFVDSLDGSVKSLKGDKEITKMRIISDLNSYKTWDDNN